MTFNDEKKMHEIDMTITTILISLNFMVFHTNKI